MKKFLLALMVFFSGLAHSQNVLTAPQAFFQHDFTNGVPRQGLCIGGARCGLDNTLLVIYPTAPYVSYMYVYAHDAVGNKSSAHLQLWADGVLIGEQDVKGAGTTLAFPVNRYTHNLQLKSVHDRGASGGDETVIMSITSY